MKGPILVCGVVFLAIAALAPAKDFPLEFKTLNAEEAMSFPSGSGILGHLQFDKLATITKAPPAVSKHPLYGHFFGRTNRLSFRLDESKGDGKGYDRLIVDMNQNDDLTDDVAVARVEQAKPVSTVSQPEITLFGPIPVSEEKKIGAWRPIFFAQMSLDTLLAKAAVNMPDAYFGKLRLKAGWYLEATVNLDGVTRKVGIVDGNGNFRVGDFYPPYRDYTHGPGTNWTFPRGDYFVVDRDGSGKFESSIGVDESAPFGPMVYLGAKPYNAVLAADCKSLALEPWAGPLAELVLQPHGEQIGGIRLAWESAPGQWQLLQPGLENGKAQVPPGNYRLYASTIKVKTAAGGNLILMSDKCTLQVTTRAKAGVSTPFKCGSPEVKITSSKLDTGGTQESGSLLGWLGSFFAGSEKLFQQRIEAQVIGAGGEKYREFFFQDKEKVRQPPNPTFTVVTTDGKQVASGKFEFG